MQVQVGLLMFAANKHNMMNSYILLQKAQKVQKDKNDKSDKDCLRIPAEPLPDDLDSVSLVQRIIKQCSGVSGRWIEMTPNQIGVFDDVHRNPNYREIFIAYSLYIPEPMKVYDDYVWVKLDEIGDTNLHNLYLDTEQIVRYTILGGGRDVI